MACESDKRVLWAAGGTEADVQTDMVPDTFFSPDCTAPPSRYPTSAISGTIAAQVIANVFGDPLTIMPIERPHELVYQFDH